ncbi:Type I restriction enzyme EcoKI specificity protein [Aerococcus viridans]|nr:Type I restriction enzyme EcoKI specificity protein [Aerococcus viridans]
MSINKNSRKAPNLRFKGFTDAWEQRKLGKIVEFYSGLTYSPDNIIPKGGTFVLRSSNVKNGELINADNVYVDSSFVNSSNVQIGDIVVVVRNGSRNLIGKHAQVKNYMENTVIGAFMTGIRAKEPNYINALLNTQQFKIEINKNLGATINQITTGAFKKMQFSITPNIEEQHEIGSFFDKLDNCITLHQRKLDQLKQLKEALLQQMFPGKGETVPKLRFAGFEGDWEELKLSSVVDKQIKGKAQADKLNPGNVEYLDTARLNGGEPFLTDAISNVMKDDILILWDGSKAGTVYIGFEGALGSTLKAYRTNSDSQFVFQYLKRYQEHIYNNYRTPNIPHVQKDFLEVFTIKVPTMKEQTKIGNTLKHLDTTITLQQRKLDQLQNMKQVLLQNMFI